jgi:hypothetical protein
LVNGKLNIYYHTTLEQSITTKFTTDDDPRLVTVQVRNGDDPVMRIEFLPTASNAKTILKLEAREVREQFQTCMVAREEHGQCLGKLGGTSAGLDLRSNKAVQKDCLGGKAVTKHSGSDSLNECGQWLNCLTDKSKTFILDAVTASTTSSKSISFDGKGKNAGFGGSVKRSFLLHTDGQSRVMGHEDCIDPRYTDIQAWDCNSYETWSAECPQDAGQDRQTCLEDLMCCHPKVCSEWKTDFASCSYPNSKCDTAPASLKQVKLLRRAVDLSSEKTENTLDQSLGDKCSAR